MEVRTSVRQVVTYVDDADFQASLAGLCAGVWLGLGLTPATRTVGDPAAPSGFGLLGAEARGFAVANCW